MKIFALGDCHGNFKALKQCLERSNFNYSEDKLIVLGDVCDGFPYVKECFEELLKIKNLVYILANHDAWCLEYYDKGVVDYNGLPKEVWTSQGGYNTLNSYGEKMIETHLNLLKNAPLYHLEDDCLFVHGGIDPHQPDIDKQDPQVLLWDRDLLWYAKTKNSSKSWYKYGGYNKIFIGHTTTQQYNSFKPIKWCNVVAIDTGAGWSGKLTIMNIKTEEYWQSDLAKKLYPDIEGR